MKKKIWTCKIGEIDAGRLPEGADWPMRDAIRRAYVELTGREPEFVFSGWGGNLTAAERKAAHYSADSPVNNWRYAE